MSKSKVEELSEVCDETEKIFNEDDENDAALDVAESDAAKRIGSAKNYAATAVADDIDAIQSLGGDLREQRDGILERLKEVETLKSRLKAARDATSGEAKELSTAVNEFDSDRRRIDADLQRLEDEAKGLTDKARGMLTVEKAKLRLYNQLTGVEWDLDVPKDIIKGVVVKESGMEAFEFDRHLRSNFEITNSLWEMMEDDL